MRNDAIGLNLRYTRTSTRLNSFVSQPALLYVEPIYLRAEQGELPELKRVIVAYNKAVVMEETLEKSLAVIFGGEQVEKKAPIPGTGAFSTLAQSALETYRKAQQALRQGNWADYGRYQQQLEDILQKLNQSNKPSTTLIYPLYHED